MRLIAYTRRSTDRQDYSHAAQLTDIASKRPGDDLTHVRDTCSGTAPFAKRDGGRYALHLLAEGQAEGLVVAKLDRMSRSLLDGAALIQRANAEGWSIICLDLGLDTSTSMGRAMAGVALTFAELERERIGERTRDALVEARRNGKHFGGPQVPETIVKRILREHEEGRSFNAIAKGLNEDGVPTARHGKRWYHSTVRGVVGTAHERLAANGDDD